jgi:hypothetical protein
VTAFFLLLNYAILGVKNNNCGSRCLLRAYDVPGTILGGHCLNATSNPSLWLLLLISLSSEEREVQKSEKDILTVVKQLVSDGQSQNMALSGFY